MENGRSDWFRPIDSFHSPGVGKRAWCLEQRANRRPAIADKASVADRALKHQPSRARSSMIPESTCRWLTAALGNAESVAVRPRFGGSRQAITTLPASIKSGPFGA